MSADNASDLFDRESLLTSVVDNAPFGAHMYILEDDDRLVFIGFNRKAEEMLGIDHGTLIGQTLEEAFPGNVGTETADAYYRIAQSGGVWETDQYAYDANGIAGVFEVHAFSFGPKQVCVFFRDVTEAKKLQLALDESRSQLTRAVTDAPYPMMIHAEDGEIIGINKAWTRISGYSSEEIPDIAAWTSKAYGDTAPVMQSVIASLFEEDAAATQGEYTIRCANGETRIWDFSTTPIGVTPDGRRLLASSAHDVTERRAADTALRSSAGQLEKMVFDVAEAMGRVVESRDPYTRGHEQRVAELAKLIALKIGMDADHIQGIEMAGFLHDVGKLSIPVEILNKPGRLSEVEFSLIQSHSERGYEILKDIDFPWPIATITLQHHERMDGSGYPKGLVGDEILMSSRVIAVADVVEAMSSHRPYRPALGMDAAIEELLSRPHLYDSACVQALIELRTEGFEIPA